MSNPYVNVHPPARTETVITAPTATQVMVGGHAGDVVYGLGVVDRLVGDRLRDELDQQPWWRRVANTVTAGVGAVVGLLWVLVSSGVDLPAPVTQWVPVVIAALTVVGIKLTPNGVTQRQIDGLTAVGRHRVVER